MPESPHHSIASKLLRQGGEGLLKITLPITPTGNRAMPVKSVALLLPGMGGDDFSGGCMEGRKTAIERHRV